MAVGRGCPVYPVRVDLLRRSPDDRRLAPSPAAGAPVLASSMVWRTRLLEVLESSTGCPVVVVSGPAGYGKTTVLAQWAAQDLRQVVWLTVHPYDDPAVLAEELVRSLGAVVEGPALPLIQDGASWFGFVLPSVARIVAGATQPVLLVVDDAGHLAGTAAEALLETVVEHLPAGSQVALATRQEPQRVLRRLRPSGEVLEIGPELLAMDAREAAALIAGLDVELDDRGFAALLRRTEGWPVGVYLLGLALRPGAPRVNADDVPTLAPGWAMRYIRDELYDALDRPTAEFLLRSSVLDELTGPACDAVTGSTGSLGRLRDLAESNSLVVPLDAAGERFRLHNLYADFLRAELLARSPDEFHVAHEAASRWFEAQGHDDAAVAHARLAGDDQRLGELVWARAPHLLASGRVGVLRRWLDGLDERRITSTCALAITAAYVASHVGDIPAMTRYVLAAESRCSDDRGPGAGGPRDLDVGLIKAVEAHGGIRQMLAHSSAAVEGLAPDDPWLTVAHYLRGVALHLLGRGADAAVELQTSLRLAKAFDLPVMEAHALAAQADLALLGGDVTQAASLAEQARALVVRHRIEHISTSAPIFTSSAQVFAAEGRLAEAAAEAARALRLTSAMGPVAPWHAVMGRLQLAQTYVHLGDADQARLLLDEARQLYTEPLHAPVADAYLAATQSLVDQVSQGPARWSTLTTAELRVLQYLPSHLSFPEIGQELFLSRHTVKSQAMSAYRKLGARSRSEAVTKARALGLLPAP